MKMRAMRNLLTGLLLVLPLSLQASESVHLDKAPINPNNKASLQRGAKAFVAYGGLAKSASRPTRGAR